MEPYELWDEPWEGLPEEDEAWTLDQNDLLKLSAMFCHLRRGLSFFIERWIKDEGKWFTRVVGLVPGRMDS